MGVMGELAQLLSESCSNYNINAEGLSQVSTPGGPSSNPAWDPASPSTPNRYFNCKGSEIRKLKVRACMCGCMRDVRASSHVGSQAVGGIRCGIPSVHIRHQRLYGLLETVLRC